MIKKMIKELKACFTSREFWISVFLAIVYTAMASWFVGDFRGEAIQNNCAQYNSQTGEFEWKEK